MLTRLSELASANSSFGFETTLASRSYATWLKELRTKGYNTHLVFLWLPSSDEAVARVAERVRTGGHDVPETTIRRRYEAGLKNLLSLYMPLANTWQLLDASLLRSPRRIAVGGEHGPARVFDQLTWQRILDKVQRP